MSQKRTNKPMTLEQPDHIDLEKWGPCEYCEKHEYPEECAMLTKSEYETDEGMYIYKGMLTCNSGELQMRKIDYCPVCGRPLTEAALAELDRMVGLCR